MAVVAVATCAATSVAAPPSASAASSIRIAGADRIATSLAIYEQNPDVFGSETVLLSRADQFPDALAAAPLAAAMKAPVLLTSPRNLDARVLESITRHQVQRVVLVGGKTAIGPAVEAALTAARVQVTRIEGRDRFATAEAAAARTSQVLGGRPVAAFVADGLTPQDALVAGAIAGRDGGVVLLSAGPRLTAGTKAYLQSQAVGTRVGIGEKGARAANSIGLAQSVYGSTPESTSIEVAKFWHKGPVNAVVTGASGWADGLAGAPLAALRRAPLILVGGRHPTAGTLAYMRTAHPRTFTVLGGERALPSSVDRDLTRAAG